MSAGPSPLKERLRGLPFYGALRKAYHLAFDRHYRGGRLLRLRPPDNLFQPFGETSEDRYPVVFGFVRDRLAGEPSLRLLSFGCSTGEEVFTLRRHFPGAFIKGIDINPRNISTCNARRARANDTNMSFTVAGSVVAEAARSYDAIFCMAVFRHGDLTHSSAERCDPLIRFEDFERTVSDLARCLKHGGLLALRHSNFRFLDAEAARDFATVLSLPPNPRTPLFGRDNRRLVGIADGNVVFRKGA